jgi:7,8-dihydropterin-6-yl-methyl-4-(beta-D-ribofuranosyl)aminobenzene 5'-phosphate synthase
MSSVQADSVEITVLVENWVDMLLPDLEFGDGVHCVRSGLMEHFDQRWIPPQAETGLSLLATARYGPLGNSVSCRELGF